MYSILLVEDNAAFASEVAAFLKEDGFSVVHAATGAEALRYIQSEPVHICLLDVGLPDCSGLQLCKQIRSFYSGPILMLTAFDQEDDIIAGLQSGADDYVTKPCSLRILRSRIGAQLRRQDRLSSQEPQRLKSGDLQIDLVHRMVYRQGTEVPLGETEFALCATLAVSDGKIMPRDLLLDRLWDSRERYVENNTLSVHISRLRKKLGSYCGVPYIDTVKGIGYRWNHEVERDLT